MKKVLLALAALAVGAFLAVPAMAITDGQPDGNGHPYVGLMVAQDEDGNPMWRCSGTLMSSTVYLTAGHCTYDDVTGEDVANVEIWFDSEVFTDSKYVSKAAGGTGCDNPLVTGYPCHGQVSGDAHTFPDFGTGSFVLRDAGVVTLDAPVSRSTYGTLPAVDSLDKLKPSRSTIFQPVGYGLQKSFPDAAAWKIEARKLRMTAFPHLKQINVPGFTGTFSITLSNNANTGGTCFGDSGGPNFYPVGSNVVAGITSFGLNSTCAGTGGVFRTDRKAVHDWIASWLD